MKLLALSDLHLGSSNCEHEQILKILQIAEDYDIIVINGDLINSHLCYLNHKDWEILSRLNELSKNHSLFYIMGNHDIHVADIISKFIGATLGEYYTVTIANKSFLFMHGHQFDEFIKRHPTLTCIADILYNLIQKLDCTRNLSRWLKKESKFIIHCYNAVRDGFLKFDNNRHDWIIAGHTHMAQNYPEVGYINLGSFTELPVSYLTIDEDGIPRLIICIN